jgi:uncharacterized membrane protein YsdA (DUF1294 family)
MASEVASSASSTGQPISLLFAVAALYVVMSVITFVIYARDKSAAGTRRRRVPENTLQLLSLLCGWPGALLAQRTLRHKTRKTRFLVVFWMVVVLNVVAVAAVLWVADPWGTNAGS